MKEKIKKILWGIISISIAILFYWALFCIILGIPITFFLYAVKIITLPEILLTPLALLWLGGLWLVAKMSESETSRKRI
jgi:hypothetical protein